VHLMIGDCNNMIFEIQVASVLASPHNIYRLRHRKCDVRIKFYSRVAKLWKTHSFAALTRSFSKVLQLVNKNPYKTLPML